MWLLAQTPAEALQIGVFADLLRPLVGVVMAALVLWRDYRIREGLLAGVLLVLAVVCVGEDVLLMTLASLVLIATFARWFTSSADIRGGRQQTGAQRRVREVSPPVGAQN
jgi:O-antigen ligase